MGCGDRSVLGDLAIPEDASAGRLSGRGDKAVSWSPDGKWLAASFLDGKILVWDAVTRMHVRTIDSPVPGLYSVAWRNDSRLIAVSGESGWAVLDAQEGRLSSQGAAGARSVCWSSDGTEVVICDRGQLAFFDPLTGERKRQAAEQWHYNLTAPAVSPSEDKFVWGGVWNADTGALLGPVDGIDSHNSLSAWSPQGDLVAAGRYVSAFALFNLALGKKVGDLSDDGAVFVGPVWSPDARELAAVDTEGWIRVWDVASRQVKCQWEGSAKDFGGLAWSPDGKRIAVQALDKVRIWEAETGGLVREYGPFPEPLNNGHNNHFQRALAWEPEGTGLWTALKHHAARIDLATGQISEMTRFTNGNAVASLALAPDGESVLGWEGYHWTFLRTYDGQRRLLGQFLGHHPQWLPDSRRFVGVDPYFGMRGFDTRRDRRLGTLWPRMSGDLWICIGPDGHYRGGSLNTPGDGTSPDQLALVEDRIVYVVQTDEGHNLTLAPAEFSKKFGWQNDPTRARLLGLDE